MQVHQGVRLLPLLGVVGGLFLLSHQSGEQLPLPDIAQFDKLLHVIAYTVLGGAYLFALPPFWLQRSRWLAATVVLFCLLHGVVDEYHQSFIPGRMVSGADLLADTLGGGLSLMGYYGWRKWGRTTMWGPRP
jgi:VanZ family protein